MVDTVSYMCVGGCMRVVVWYNNRSRATRPLCQGQRPPRNHLNDMGGLDKGCAEREIGTIFALDLRYGCNDHQGNPLWVLVVAQDGEHSHSRGSCLGLCQCHAIRLWILKIDNL
jgi:hypothetical protein